MATFLKSIFGTICTFFSYIYTLVLTCFTSNPKVHQYPLDLECGPDLRERTKKAALLAQYSPSIPPAIIVLSTMNLNPAVGLAHSDSPQSHSHSSLNDISMDSERSVASVTESPRHSGPPPTSPPQAPLPPLKRFVFPAFPSLQSNSTADSIHSASASPVSQIKQRPRSAHSASSTISDTRSQTSTYSSNAYVTPTKKRTHRKQSPIVWYKDGASFAASGSCSSLGSIQSAGSSTSFSSHHRHRSLPLDLVRGMKCDPSMSFKRYAARLSRSGRQSKPPRPSRPESEDPVSFVRQVFVECGTEVDTEGGGARERLVNRETARSFGGMEIVDEEDEEDEPLSKFCRRPRIPDLLQENSNASSCSTPESSGPVTPLALPSPPTPLQFTTAGSSELLKSSPERSTMLPYVRDRSSVALSALGLVLPSTESISSKCANRHSHASDTYAADQRVSVVTWSDLVSFSSYEVSALAEEQQQENEKGSQEQVQVKIQVKDRLKAEGEGEAEEAGEGQIDLDNSGIELTAVLDSISVLVGQGLDAHLLLSLPWSGHGVVA